MFRKMAVASLVLMLGAAGAAMAQDNTGPGGPPPDGGPGGPGGGPGGPGGGPPEMRLKAELGVTDDEWSALQPKIRAVVQLERQLHPRPPGRGPGGPRGFGGPGGPGGGPDGQGNGGNAGHPGGPDGASTQGDPGDMQGGPGGPGGPGGDMPRGPGGPDANSPVGKATIALHAVLKSKTATPDDIKSAMAKLREARAAAKADLVKAQEDLKGSVTTKQEAELLSVGILE